MLAEAKRPVLYAGQGVHWARAWSGLRQLAELLGAPVTTSLGGKSAFPEDHPLALGSGGLAVPKTVRHFLDQADVIFGIGCSFTESNFAVAMPKGKKIIHATLDPDHLNKDIAATLGLVGDAGVTLDGLLAELAPMISTPRNHSGTAQEIADMQAAWLAEWKPKLTSTGEAAHALSRHLGSVAHGRCRQHDHHARRRQPARSALAVLGHAGAAHLHRLGQDHPARLWPWAGHGGEARPSRQALHQRLGRCRHRIHRHGFRDGGARAHPHPVDPVQQFLHGHRAQGHADLDRKIPLDRHFRRLRR